MDVKALGILNTLSLVLKIPCSLLEKLSIDTYIHSKTSTCATLLAYTYIRIMTVRILTGVDKNSILMVSLM